MQNSEILKAYGQSIVSGAVIHWSWRCLVASFKNLLTDIVMSHRGIYIGCARETG